MNPDQIKASLQGILSANFINSFTAEDKAEIRSLLLNTELVLLDARCLDSSMNSCHLCLLLHGITLQEPTFLQP